MKRYTVIKTLKEMNTTAQHTHGYLQMTKQEFDNDCMERYMRWIINMAKISAQKQNRDYITDAEIQSLLSNTAIANYYRYQYAEIEQDFKSFAFRVFGLIPVNQMRENYNRMMYGLYLNYPNALIEAAKKVNIVNPPFTVN